MNTWTLTVDAICPSANPFMRLHWRARLKLAKAWNWLLLEQVLKPVHDGTGLSPARRKRQVKITSYRRGEPDPQNLYLAHDKCILDQLIRLGVLIDDSAKWCEFSVVSQRAGKLGKRTVIEIREE